MKAVPNRKNDGLLSPNKGQSVLPPTDLALSSNVKNAYCEDPGYCETRLAWPCFDKLTAPNSRTTLPLTSHIMRMHMPQFWTHLFNGASRSLVDVVQTHAQIIHTVAVTDIIA